ncbi:4-hydroxy-3-methylbut-2-enyl diphosphate reductase, partial [Candidatus Roizmanbacteria bacterium CG17_big_fil_post_rev_8_21_14_2_50_39_7]
PEATGVMGEVPKDSIMLIDSLRDVNNLKVSASKRMIVLTQTTLSVDDTKLIVNEIRKKYPYAILPPAFDICYATQNRQNAVKELARKAQIIFVVGSKTSSNSNKLRETAVKQGIEAHLINGKTEIDPKWLERKSIVGVTAGASAPDELISEVINYLSNKETVVEEITTIKESIIFPLPKNL